MKDIYVRTKQIAQYVATTGATVRSAAKVFGLSKSTVHYDLSKRLPYIDASLYLRVKNIMEKNFFEKNIRGGLATKRRYSNKKYR